MRIYTKEWHELSDYLASVDMFEPIEDGDYSDEDIERLYQRELDKYLNEERELYDEPPYFDIDEWIDENPREEFDPEDYLVGDITEDGEEINLRSPESYEELMEYSRKEYEREQMEYDSREPFNEEEEREFFEEMYEDSLDEPDTDIPAWIRESVDPRLIALNLLPRSVYDRLLKEEELKQKRLDELDELAERILEEYEDEDGEESEELEEMLGDIQSGYILGLGETDGSFEIEMISWDFDEDDDDDEAEDMQVRRIYEFVNAVIIENEEPVIEAETDEDDDVVSNCELMDYELYPDDGRYEVHMLLDNGEYGLKYLTLSCDRIITA